MDNCATKPRRILPLDVYLPLIYNDALCSSSSRLWSEWPLRMNSFIVVALLHCVGDSVSRLDSQVDPSQTPRVAANESQWKQDLRWLRPLLRSSTYRDINKYYRNPALMPKSNSICSVTIIDSVSASTDSFDLVERTGPNDRYSLN